MARLPRCHRSFHTSIHTITHPTLPTLNSHLKSLPLAQNSTAFYLLHPDLPQISSLLSTIQSALSPYPTIGSFAHSPTGGPNDPPFIALAIFTPDSPTEQIKPFRSDLHGRPSASVGRWYRPTPQSPGATHSPTSPSEHTRRSEDRKGEQVGEMERVLMGSLGYEKGQGMGWEGVWKSERMEDVVEGEMKGLTGLDGVTGVKSMLLLSDGIPNTTLTALDRHFPYASKLGLLTTATPFLTNKPYTLFQNKEIFEHGAVGLAFCDSASTNTEGTMRVGIDYTDLQPLSQVETIATAQGNLLLTILPSSSKTTNPTQLLIKVLNDYQKASLSTRPSEASDSDQGIVLGKKMKEEEYYLALWEEHQEKPKEVVRILSGDPSRGALSLDTEQSLRAGQKVQFLHKPVKSPTGSSSPNPSMIGFTTLPACNERPSDKRPDGQAEVEVVQGIQVGTEGGFFYAPGERVGGSVCKVIQARGWVDFSPFS